jgi:hypothetical protein
VTQRLADAQYFIRLLRPNRCHSLSH